MDEQPTTAITQLEPKGRVVFGCSSSARILLTDDIAGAFVAEANAAFARQQTRDILGRHAAAFAATINEVDAFPFHAQLVDGAIQLSFTPSSDALPVIRDISKGINKVNRTFMEALRREGANDVESIKFPVSTIFQSGLHAAYVAAGFEGGPSQEGRGGC